MFCFEISTEVHHQDGAMYTFFWEMKLLVKISVKIMHSLYMRLRFFFTLNMGRQYTTFSYKI